MKNKKMHNHSLSLGPHTECDGQTALHPYAGICNTQVGDPLLIKLRGT